MTALHRRNSQFLGLTTTSWYGLGATLTTAVCLGYLAGVAEAHIPGPSRGLMAISGISGSGLGYEEEVHRANIVNQWIANHQVLPESEPLMIELFGHVFYPFDAVLLQRQRLLAECQLAPRLCQDDASKLALLKSFSLSGYAAQLMDSLVTNMGLAAFFDNKPHSVLNTLDACNIQGTAIYRALHDPARPWLVSFIDAAACEAKATVTHFASLTHIANQQLPNFFSAGDLGDHEDYGTYKTAANMFGRFSATRCGF